ncbi:chromosome partitioning protein ParA [Salmonella enterica subsp. enterica serovar Kentucky]|nr:chromosome partitioning protein ParA [Salmonella enterica subsp. enterica serovar Kentucky]
MTLCLPGLGDALALIPSERIMKWFTEFGHLNRGDMLTSEQHRCHNEKKKFQRRV